MNNLQFLSHFYFRFSFFFKERRFPVDCVDDRWYFIVAFNI